MSKFNQGILGGFSGKTGSVIGSTWKGKAVMRGLPQLKKKRKSSQDQIDQQEKFKLMVAFLAGLSELFNITYKKQAVGISGFNAAVSYNIRTAITGFEAPFGIDYAKLQFGSLNGNMPNVVQPTVVAQANNNLKFIWSNNAGLGKAKASDKPLVMVYSPAQGQFIYTKNGAVRADETVTINAALFAGEAVETWLLFLSDDESAVSATAYTGPVTLIP
jgi:hypothetical protein